MKKTNKIRKAAVSVLCTFVFVGSLLLVGCVETESMMKPTYTTEAVVVENEYISRTNYIITVDVDGENYRYYADSPEKLLSKVTVEMHSKGTLKKSDDEVIDAY